MGEMQEVDETTTWATQTFGLDTRLVKACKKNGWVAPLLVQRHAVPCIMSGKDVLCRARTGAGKTAAYLLPVLHKTLQRKSQVAYDVSALVVLLAAMVLVGLRDPAPRRDPKDASSSSSSSSSSAAALYPHQTEADEAMYGSSGGEGAAIEAPMLQQLLGAPLLANHGPDPDP